MRLVSARSAARRGVISETHDFPHLLTRRTLMGTRPHQRRQADRSRCGRGANMLARRLSYEPLERRLLLAVDFGDAPQPFATDFADDGARHEAIGVRLGATRDAEPNGVPSPAADSDGADDDGVVFGTIQVGRLAETVSIDVQNAGGGARVDAWIDFNRDGHWGGAFEHIVDDVELADGVHALEFDVPSWAVAGTTFARVRISSAGSHAPAGYAADGEVEDYAVQIIPPATATGQFLAEHVIVDSLEGGEDVFAADIDRDGDMDVLSQSDNDGAATFGRVAWHENDGDQNFTNHSVTTGAGTAGGIYVADLDGDGHRDLVSAALNVDRLSWYKNDGSENFTRRTMGGTSIGMSVADIDSDGDLDVVTANWFSGNDHVLWYENLGSNAFAQRTVVSGVSGVQNVAAVDLDRDGHMDIVAAKSSGYQVLWLKNDGNQNFTSHVIHENPGSPSLFTVISVFPADIDGDGDIDIVSGPNVTGDIHWHENDGQQSFTLHVLDGDVGRSKGVTSGDIDGDGDMDIVAASSNTVDWYENQPGVGFARHTVVANAPKAVGVFVADMDDDADLDIVATFENDNSVRWYENANPTVSVSVESAVVAEETDQDLVFVFERAGQNLGPAEAAFEIAGSAFLGIDYVVSGATMIGNRGVVAFPRGATVAPVTVSPIDDGEIELSETVVVTLDDSQGILIDDAPAIGQITSAEFGGDFGDAPAPYPTTTAMGGAGHSLRGPRLGAQRDVEADGVPSAAADGDGGDEDGVQLGPIRVGQVGATVSVDVQNAPAGAHIIGWVDFNRDGNWSGPTEKIINAILSEGVHAVTFDVPASASVGATYARFRISTQNGLAAGGVAGDGEVEDYAVEILPAQAASGVFDREHVITDDLIWVSDVFAVDFDRDGDMDALSAARNDQITLFINDGNGTYTQQTIAFDADYAQSVSAADLDGDGDIDVLSASDFDDTIAWYENQGGAFVPHILTTEADQAYDVSAADMDGDGDLDILFASRTLGWFENDGDQSFTLRTIDFSTIRATFAIPIDLDGDGDLDVIANLDAGQQRRHLV